MGTGCFAGSENRAARAAPFLLLNMLNSPFFDTILSLITLYLIFSQLTLSLVELPAGVLNTRGTYLHARLGDALGPALRDAFYQAPTIVALTLPRAQKNPLVAWVPRWPSYLSETLFAQTIIGQVAGAAAGPTPLDRFSAGLKSLPPTSFTGTLQTLYDNALSVGATPAEQSAALQRNLEGWFHDFGERLTGWYKRDNRKYLFLVGLLVAVLADVDSVRLVRFIGDSKNAAARLVLVEAGLQATQAARPAAPAYNPTTPAGTSPTMPASQVFQQADSLFRQALAAVPAAGLPLGLLRWAHPNAQRTDTTTVRDPASHQRKYAKPATYRWAPTADDFGMPAYAQRWQLDAQTGQVSLAHGFYGFLKILGGWLLTAFAMMLGAPFWFDTLCRFVNIRNVGIKPKSSN